VREDAVCVCVYCDYLAAHLSKKPRRYDGPSPSGAVEEYSYPAFYLSDVRQDESDVSVHIGFFNNPACFFAFQKLLLVVYLFQLRLLFPGICPIRAEHLESIVFRGVVGGSYHDTGSIVHSS